MAEFSYFDQFVDIDYDLSGYLNTLNKVNNISIDDKYTFTNKQPIKTTVKNLFDKFDVVFNYKDNIEVIINYEIKDNDTMQTIAYDLYGDVNLWWIIAIFNDIKDPYNDWPLTQSQIIEVTNRIYNTEHKFSYNTYARLINATNEDKRNIIVPKKQTVKDIIWKYREAILNG
jgi:hypothetical protein